MSTCLACSHPDLDALELELRRGLKSAQGIAKQFNLPIGVVEHHRNECYAQRNTNGVEPTPLSKSDAMAEIRAQAAILRRMALNAGDIKLAIAALSAETKATETHAKLDGEIAVSRDAFDALAVMLAPYLGRRGYEAIEVSVLPETIKTPLLGPMKEHIPDAELEDVPADWRESFWDALGEDDQDRQAHLDELVSWRKQQ